MRLVVAGLFEGAKRYWSAGILSKLAIAGIGILAIISTSLADIIAWSQLALEFVASAMLYRSDYLKDIAEPLLASLDLEDGLGWNIPRELAAATLSDFKKFETLGFEVRQNEEYFDSHAQTGPARLADNVAESAHYTSALSGATCRLTWILVVALAVIAVGAAARGVTSDRPAGALFTEVAVAVLTLLAALDLLPLSLRYGELSKRARSTIDRLSAVGAGRSDLRVVIPIALEYQIARAMAPLLPTFAFLQRRGPLGEIWSKTGEGNAEA